MGGGMRDEDNGGGLRWLDPPPPLPGLGLPLLVVGTTDPRPSWQRFEDECRIERKAQARKAEGRGGRPR